MQAQGVTLDTIGGGALSELFDAELARILANIADPNTDTSAKRVVTISVSFKPNLDRDVADVELKCSSNCCESTDDLEDFVTCPDCNGKGIL